MRQRQLVTNSGNIAARESSWREYVHEIQKGNADALACLYDTSAPLLFNLVFRILRNTADAEEVLLDIFEQVWRTAHSFDPARGGVWQWLMLLARSRSLDRLRSLTCRRLHEHVSPTGWPELCNPAAVLEEVIASTQQQKLLRRALFALPPNQRKVLEMAYFSGLSHAEIAAALGVPLGTIKTRIRMAIGKLRVALCPVPAEGSVA